MFTGNEPVLDSQTVAPSDCRCVPSYASYWAGEPEVGRLVYNSHEWALHAIEAQIELSGREVTEMHGKANIVIGTAEEAIANCDDAIRINPEDAEIYFRRGLARKILRQISLAKSDLKCARSLAQKQGRKGLLRSIERELENLNTKTFRVEPHSSEYAPGVDPDKLKEILYDLDDEHFARKNLK